MDLINRIRITGLNEQYTVDLRLRDKHCIIVGPNGVGKSTALQIIACAMGRQWETLSKLRFSDVEFHFSSGVISAVSRAACAGYSSSRRRKDITVARERLERRGDIDKFLDANPESSEFFRDFSYVWPDPSLLPALQDQMKRFVRGTGVTRSEVTTFERSLDEHSVPIVYFLPTSRRIEFDLDKLIVKSLPSYVRASLSEAFERQPPGKYFEEVVRFGMQDVTEIIRTFEGNMRDKSRQRFNRMISMLLKDMAEKKATSVTEVREQKVTDELVERVLSRIEEDIISPGDRTEISQIIRSMAQPGSGNPGFHKMWLAHFFIRLLSVDREMAADERPMRDFVNRLNKYLQPKRADYDIESYHFSIQSNDMKKRELGLGELSSGEKQLISILAMVEFSDDRLNVLVDEPELSLAAQWQTTFLEDITETEQCHQLFAVTHSPFVFDNSLKKSVIDFATCIS